jgi:hypothetical protein
MLAPLRETAALRLVVEGEVLGRRPVHRLARERRPDEVRQAGIAAGRAVVT